MSDGEEEKPQESRAAKSIKAIEGNDEFSISATRDPRKPKVVLQPSLSAPPMPKGMTPQTRDGNLLLRLLAKIFR